MNHRSRPTAGPRARHLGTAALVWLLCGGLGVAATAEATPRRGLQVYAHTLEHRPASDVLSVIEPLLSSEGRVEVQPGDNTLVIRDTAATIEKVKIELATLDREPEDLRFDIQIVRAGPRRAISPPLPPDQEIPGEVIERLRDLLRYEDYRLLAKAGMTSSEGEEVTYSLGQTYSVSFRLGSVIAAGEGAERLRLEDFRIVEKPVGTPNKGRQLEPKQLFRATLNLWVDRPFNIVLPQSASEHEALMVAISCRRETGTEDGGDP